MVNQAETNQNPIQDETQERPLGTLDLAKAALAELEKGNIFAALELRHQVVRRMNLSEEVLEILGRFTEMADLDKVILMDLAVLTVKSGNVTLAEKLAQKSLAIWPNMRASASYVEFQKLLLEKSDKGERATV